MNRSVAVTGVGAVSTWGWGVDALWQGLCSNQSGVGSFSRLDHADFATHVAGQAPPEPAGLRSQLPHPRQSCLADRFALAATLEALAGAGLEPPLAHAGVYFASSTGGIHEAELYYQKDQDGRRADLRQVANHFVSSPGDAVARQLQVTGPVSTISSACASGTLAIGTALDAVRGGDVEVAVAGGSDTLCYTTYGGFNALRSVDTDPCRPFREDRNGLSLGEGAGVLVLESVESAQRRGVVPLALLLGAGSTNDAHHMTAPHPDGTGAALAMQRALRDADTTEDQIAFVNAHGTGTPLNDVAERKALQQALGERANRVPVTATKGSVGHLLGSAGSLEAVATVLCLERGQVHPTPGEGSLDPEANVDLVRDQPRRLGHPAQALSLNLGFGGCNAALVLSSSTQETQPS